MIVIVLVILAQTIIIFFNMIYDFGLKRKKNSKKIILKNLLI